MCPTLGSTWRSVWSDSVHLCITLAVWIYFEKCIIKQFGHCANIKKCIIQMKMAIASLSNVTIWKTWYVFGLGWTKRPLRSRWSYWWGWTLRWDQKGKVVFKGSLFQIGVHVLSRKYNSLEKGGLSPGKGEGKAEFFSCHLTSWEFAWAL